MSVNRGLLSLAPNGSLTVEQIAALPCAGIVALQAMEMLCADLPSGSKVEILIVITRKKYLLNCHFGKKK